MVADDLRHPKRGLEPVEDREPVAHDPGEGLDAAEHQEDERPERQRSAVLLLDPALDRPADRVRHQRLSDHPDDPEEDPGRDRGELLPPDPDEETDWRSRVGHARVVRGQADPGAVEPPARSVQGYGIALVHGFWRDCVPT